jgi:hypothetical protein
MPGSARDQCDDAGQARDSAREWSVLIREGSTPAQIAAKAEEKARVRGNTVGPVAESYFTDKLSG